LNDNSSVEVNGSLEESVRVTEQEILDRLNESEEIIVEMRENNFTITYVNDTFVEAGRVLEQVRYAEILRNKTAHPKEREEARIFLSLIDWENLTYVDVLTYVEEIEDRRERAFFLYDSLGVAEIDLQSYKERNVNVTGARELVDEARVAFYEDRYEDSRDLLEVARAQLRIKSLGKSTFSVLSQGAKNLVQKYWERYWFIIIALAAQISVIGFFLFRRIYKKYLEKQIWKMRIRRETIVELLKETQRERFKRRKISELVYNIRMKKYQEELGKIREMLPVFEAKLDKLTIRKGYLRRKEFGH
jgi:hypothetical protein